MADSRRWLRREFELELLKQDLLIFFRFRVARQNESATISGRQMHIDHLQGGELLQNSPRCQSRRQGAQPMFQRDLQAVSDKRNEDVGIDTILALMVDRADGKVVFEFLEGLLDFGELKVVFPQFGGIFTVEIGAQQVTAFTAPHLAELGLVQREGEGSRIDPLIGVGQVDVHQAIGPTRFLFGGPQFEQQLIPRQLLLLQIA